MPVDAHSPPQVPARRRGGWVLVFLALSLLGHVVGFEWLSLWAAQRPQLAPQRPVDLLMVEVEPPKPAPPPPEPVPEPEPTKPAPRPPPPLKVARPEAPTPPPLEQLPPPPNDAPPPEPSAKPVPLFAGISLSSTTSTGTFSAPVGNTAYGKVGERAPDPAEVKAYVAPRYAPVYQVDREPKVRSQPRIEYPREAKEAGVEGVVVLSVAIGADGAVREVKVLSGPGYGLDEAARRALLQFRFDAPTRGGEPVATELTYRYTFFLE
jgi:periplasmic protein TonB